MSSMGAPYRQEPEKWLDSKIKGRASKHLSRKPQKQAWNRYNRRRAHRNPECLPLAKYQGWEW